MKKWLVGLVVSGLLVTGVQAETVKEAGVRIGGNIQKSSTETYDILAGSVKLKTDWAPQTAVIDGEKCLVVVNNAGTKMYFIFPNYTIVVNFE
jgi:hypothetical protein